MSEPAAALEPVQGNWWSLKTVAEKQEIMEGWLHQFQTDNQASKKAILKEIQNTKLSAADKVLLEKLRVSFKYPRLPQQ